MNQEEKQAARENYLKKETLEHKALEWMSISRVIATAITLVSASWQVIAASIGADILFYKFNLLWQGVPFLFNSKLSCLICALIVVVIGLLAYQLRKRARFTYASLELGVAATTAYNAAIKLPSSKDSFTALLALLGSIYIVVRACDNFMKWNEEQNLTGKNTSEKPLT